MTRQIATRGRKGAIDRARSAPGAFRHGLSLPVVADPTASEDIAALIRAIAPATRAPREAVSELCELAHRIAEAQLDLARVRRARHDLIADALAGSDEVSSRSAGDRTGHLEIAAGIAPAPGPRAPLLAHAIARLRHAPSEPERLALVLDDLAPRLAAMDRYERRARSRRKRAIEAYDQKKVYFRFLQSQVAFGRTNPNPPSHRREAPA